MYCHLEFLAFSQKVLDVLTCSNLFQIRRWRPRSQSTCFMQAVVVRICLNCVAKWRQQVFLGHDPTFADEHVLTGCNVCQTSPDRWIHWHRVLIQQQCPQNRCRSSSFWVHLVRTHCVEHSVLSSQSFCCTSLCLPKWYRMQFLLPPNPLLSECTAWLPLMYWCTSSLLHSTVCDGMQNWLHVANRWRNWIVLHCRHLWQPSTPVWYSAVVIEQCPMIWATGVSSNLVFVLTSSSTGETGSALLFLANGSGPSASASKLLIFDFGTWYSACSSVSASFSSPWITMPYVVWVVPLPPPDGVSSFKSKLSQQKWTTLLATVEMAEGSAAVAPDSPLQSPAPERQCTICSVHICVTWSQPRLSQWHGVKLILTADA